MNSQAVWHLAFKITTIKLYDRRDKKCESPSSTVNSMLIIKLDDVLVIVENELGHKVWAELKWDVKNAVKDLINETNAYTKIPESTFQATMCNEPYKVDHERPQIQHGNTPSDKHSCTQNNDLF